MKVITVTSSVISKMAWANDVLIVVFENGSTYVYVNVPYVVYQAILESGSRGRAFNALVKGTFEGVKLTD